MSHKILKLKNARITYQRPTEIVEVHFDKITHFFWEKNYTRLVTFFELKEEDYFVHETPQEIDEILEKDYYPYNKGIDLQKVEMVLELNKVYKARNGAQWKVVCLNTNANSLCSSVLVNKPQNDYRECDYRGRFFKTSTNPHDLIELVGDEFTEVSE